MTASYAPLLSRSLAAFEADPTSRSREHLAGYSFRFEPDAPQTAVPRPIEGDAWTLAQTLQEIRVRDLEVVQTTTGLRVRHGWRMPDVVQAVVQHEKAISAWLRLGSPVPAAGWDDEMALWVSWLEGFEPSGGIELHPGVTITDWSRFVSSVVGRYQAGPEIAGVDSLRRDLEALFTRHAVTAPVPVAPMRIARAA
ncbi:hypothetical protein [Rubrivirga sp.]|uniref:hypothetical protein n=1 Tax=Rubrivirga sp. TaxID=1885344 RepID=UPI003C75B040